MAAPFPAQKRTEMGWTTGVMGQRQTPAGDPMNQSLVTQHCFLKPSLRAWLEQKKKVTKGDAVIQVTGCQQILHSFASRAELRAGNPEQRGWAWQGTAEMPGHRSVCKG